MDAQDDLPDVDPLFLGLTMPPLIWGVPLSWFVLNFMQTGMGLIAFTGLFEKLLWVIFISVPFHFVGYVATEKDAHWMSVWMTFLQRCGPTRNKQFWGSNSFSP